MPIASRRNAAIAGSAALIAVVLLIPALAHEGHAPSGGATFDPNAPKFVSGPTALAIGLATAEIDFGVVEDVIRLTGWVEAIPDRSAVVAPRFGGVVRSVSVRVGDAVEPGQSLVALHSAEVARVLFEVEQFAAERERLLAEIAGGESDVASLRIRIPAAAEAVALAESEIARLATAGESVSVNVLAQRRADAIALRADAALRVVELGGAEAELAALRRQVDATEQAATSLLATLPGSNDASGTDRLGDPATPGLLHLSSSIGGVVTSRLVVDGQGVEAGETLLAIADLRNVQIEVEVPERLLGRLSAEALLEVRIRRSAPESPLALGTVRGMTPVVDAISRTGRLVVEADNAEAEFRLGESVQVVVVLRRNESAVVAPLSAIVKEGPLEYVFVREGEGENQVYLKRDVATGQRDDRVVEIREGLVPGDVVVTAGAFSLAQLRGFVPGSAEPTPPAASGDGHGHTH